MFKKKAKRKNEWPSFPQNSDIHNIIYKAYYIWKSVIHTKVIAYSSLKDYLFSSYKKNSGSWNSNKRIKKMR